MENSLSKEGITLCFKKGEASVLKLIFRKQERSQQISLSRQWSQHHQVRYLERFYKRFSKKDFFKSCLSRSGYDVEWGISDVSPATTPVSSNRSYLSFKQEIFSDRQKYFEGGRPQYKLQWLQWLQTEVGRSHLTYSEPDSSQSGAKSNIWT